MLNEKLEIFSDTSLAPIIKEKGIKIKIGILSSDIKGNHVVNNFTSILENYNRNEFDISLFFNIDIKTRWNYDSV